MPSNGRRIKKVFTPLEVAEGRGARVKRVIGANQLKSLDPFVMMDHASIGVDAGFPPHPHRGFETVSHIILGNSVHEDFKGNHGELKAGDVQWMTAGRGIMHAEGPKDGPLEGIQLWVNLRSNLKMCEPAYQHILSETIAIARGDGSLVKIIAGQALGISSPTITRTPAYYLDIDLQANKDFHQTIPSGWNSLIFMLNGSVTIEGTQLSKGQCGVLDQAGEDVFIHSDNDSRLILLAGEPLNEPIVQHGPFVMNTQAEIQQAINDFRHGRNGFEGADTWESTIV